MKQSSLVRVITALFLSALIASSSSGAPVMAEEGSPFEGVMVYAPIITKTCEGFTYSHTNYRSPNESLGVIAYEYEISGSGATATTEYSPNDIISVTYDDSGIINNSLVTLRASYATGFKHQLGQSRVISEPCEVEPPFEGVMAYTPIVSQTCEGFTYSHTNFRSPNEYLGDAERYEIVITGDGAIAQQAYEPDTMVSVTYEDSTIQNNSEVRLFADYGDGTWFQLGVTQIAPQPCEIEEPGDNGDEDPGNGDQDPGNGDEAPGNGDEEPGDNGGEHPGDNGGEEPGDNGDEDPGDIGGEEPGENGEETPDTGDTDGADEELDPADDPVEVSGLPSTGSGSTTAGLLALASGAMVLLGGAAMITRFGSVRR